MNEKEKNPDDPDCFCHVHSPVQYDYHGIYAGKMCDNCFEKKFKQYDYTKDSDENINDDY